MTSFAINVKMIHALSDADYKDVEKISMSEDMKEPIYIIPIQEHKKNWANLWGGLISSRDIFYNLQKALLKSYLTGDESCVGEYCKDGKNETLEKILDLILLDPEDETLKTIQSEIDAEKEWTGLKDSDKTKAWRDRKRMEDGWWKDIVRRLLAIFPVMLVFGNTLGSVMKM